jgi:hypothetical protein
MIIKAEWTGTADADLSLAINNIPSYISNGLPVGYITNRLLTVSPSLSWGGDTKGAANYEYFAVDFISLSAIDLSVTSINLGISGRWFNPGTPIEHPDTITLTYYGYDTGDLYRVGQTFVSTAFPSAQYTRSYYLAKESSTDNFSDLAGITDIFYQVLNNRVYIP